jgi:hypothetical protein
VYTGRADGVQDGLGKRVVVDLSRRLEGLKYHLYFDNFFSSVSLLNTLLGKGLYACGTARQSYKEFPVALAFCPSGGTFRSSSGMVLWRCCGETTGRSLSFPPMPSPTRRVWFSGDNVMAAGSVYAAQ